LRGGNRFTVFHRRIDEKSTKQLKVGSGERKRRIVIFGGARILTKALRGGWGGKIEDCAAVERVKSELARGAVAKKFFEKGH